MKVHSSTLREFKDCIESFPDKFLTEEMAQSNHSQSLNRLNERGGLSVNEILANVFNKDFKWIVDNPQEQWQVDAIKLIVDNA